MIDQSEPRQQRELALRLSQVAGEVDAQHQADLLRIQQDFGRQQEMMDYLVKTSGGVKMKKVRGLASARRVVRATSVGAQSPVQPASDATSPQIEARRQIASFEAALEDAVRLGTQMLDRRLQASSAANMVMLAGLARARGFRLDDYGVLFDVEFPSMRRSMVWSLQELERASTGRAKRAAKAASSIKPREIYESEITEALVEPCSSSSGCRRRRRTSGLRLPPGRAWSTGGSCAGGAGEPAMTVILRVKGSDLHALRAGARTRDEAGGRRNN